MNNNSLKNQNLQIDEIHVLGHKRVHPNVIAGIFHHFTSEIRNEDELGTGISQAMNAVKELDICKSAFVEMQDNPVSLNVSVQELPNLKAKLGTEIQPGVGGSFFASAGLRNAFGNAEKISTSLRWEQAGNVVPTFQFQFLKPLFGQYWKGSREKPTIGLENIETNLSHRRYDYSGLNSHQETTSTASISVTGSESQHKLSLSTSLIELLASDTASPSIASLCGEEKNLKTAIGHSFTYTRASQSSYYPVRKSKGSINIVSELAGMLLGTVHHFRCKFEGFWRGSLLLGSPKTWEFGINLASTAGILAPIPSLNTIQMSTWNEILEHLAKSPSFLCDRFYLGGPGQVRGFAPASICPKQERQMAETEVIQEDTTVFNHFATSMRQQMQPNATRSSVDALGGDLMAAVSARLTATPPIFKSRLTGHIFANAGQCMGFAELLKSIKEKSNVLESTRVSVGGGIVINLGDSGRLEVNYCVPVRSRENDVFRRIQVGLASDFL